MGTYAAMVGNFSASYEDGNQSQRQAASAAITNYENTIYAALERDYVGRPLTVPERILGRLNREDTRTPREIVRRDNFKPKQATKEGATKYGHLINRGQTAKIDNDPRLKEFFNNKLSPEERQQIYYKLHETRELEARAAKENKGESLDANTTYQKLIDEEVKLEIEWDAFMPQAKVDLYNMALEQFQFDGGCLFAAEGLANEFFASRQSRHEANQAKLDAKLEAVELERSDIMQRQSRLEQREAALEEVINTQPVTNEGAE